MRRADDDAVDREACRCYDEHLPAPLASTASITIRNLDGGVKERLRVRAARNGRSMKAELRAIITEAVDAPTQPPEINLDDRIRVRVETLGGVDLNLPPRQITRDPPIFD